MALLRVTMIAEEVTDCPTYAKGDQITIDYPQIVLEETNKVCISALNQCQPYILPLLAKSLAACVAAAIWVVSFSMLSKDVLAYPSPRKP